MDSESGRLVIRPLRPADAAEFFPLRMRALREHPEAFSSAYEDQAGLDLATFAQKYMPEPTPDHLTLGAWLDGVLVGTLGFFRASGRKIQHHAELGRMHVAPEVRRQGVGWALLQAALQHARNLPGLEQLGLGVMATNQEAIALYKKAGFVQYSLVPDYLKIEGRYYDLVEMILYLRPDWS